MLRGEEDERRRRKKRKKEYGQRVSIRKGASWTLLTKNASGLAWYSSNVLEESLKSQFMVRNTFIVPSDGAKQFEDIEVWISDNSNTIAGCSSLSSHSQTIQTIRSIGIIAAIRELFEPLKPLEDHSNNRHELSSPSLIHQVRSSCLVQSDVLSGI